MSLIKCPECKKKISNKAEHCVKCGCPIKKSMRNLNEITIENLNIISKLPENSNNNNSSEEPITTYIFKTVIMLTHLAIVIICLTFTIYYTCQYYETANKFLFRLSLICIIQEFCILLIYFFTDWMEKNFKKLGKDKLKDKLKYILYIISCCFVFTIVLLMILNIFLIPGGNTETMTVFWLCVISFIASIMAKEIMKEKDQNYIISYLALIATIIIAIFVK